VDLPPPRWSAENRLHENFIGLREKIYRGMRRPESPRPETGETK
jgi:hypothetical protein